MNDDSSESNYKIFCYLSVANYEIFMSIRYVGRVSLRI